MDTSLALLSLGSNVEPLPHLQHAVAALRGRFGPLRVSPAYRTPAVGFDGPDFLNAAVALHTDLSLDALEAWLHELEAREGRVRTPGKTHSDRTLDVDVVFLGGLVLEQGGKRRIPRPELKHAFVLKPLADVAPDFVDPVSGRTLTAMWLAHPQHGQSFQAMPLA